MSSNYTGRSSKSLHNLQTKKWEWDLDDFVTDQSNDLHSFRLFIKAQIRDHILVETIRFRLMGYSWNTPLKKDMPLLILIPKFPLSQSHDSTFLIVKENKNRSSTRYTWNHDYVTCGHVWMYAYESSNASLVKTYLWSLNLGGFKYPSPWMASSWSNIMIDMRNSIIKRQHFEKKKMGMDIHGITHQSISSILSITQMPKNYHYFIRNL